MLYLYPSNRLEDLAILLAEVVKVRPKNILSPTKVLVPNPGMQHWLNMQLCDHLGVSMNIDCPMPTRYIWDLCRDLVGAENIPQKSPYKRDVLTWKIYELVQSEACEQCDFYAQLRLYWRHAETPTDKHRRMFSFARELADLFEQYLVFRPDWLLAWEKQQSQHFDSTRYQHFQKWQLWFWNQLREWKQEHPVSLQNKAIAALSSRHHILPDDIYIFSINSLSPIYLTFFDAISQYTNVHMFQLNPCVNYWGDSQSDVAIAKLHRKQAMAQSLDEEQVHPLLRNLGAQGRDLNNLLAQMTHQEIAAFDISVQEKDVNNNGSLHLLGQLQQDILSGVSNNRTIEFDESIAIHACHSEVRELQVLKDILLDKFTEIPDLQPKDILVMCPSIESYSPYIRSIFTQSCDAKLNLPVSISDRQPIESQAYIVAFLQLLTLPMTRFDAGDIIDLLSLPALANKFALSPSDIDMCANWLKDAGIDWGKNAAHLSHEIGMHIDDDMHTWDWGVSRLLVGMINTLNDALVDGFAPVSYLEGQVTLIFGRFLQALEALQQVSQLLKQPQSIEKWSENLLFICESYLQKDEIDNFAHKLLIDAISTIEQNVSLAQYNDCIELPIIKDALKSVLSIPEVRSQFYSGNITFCSMLPMRSIPFKVIAILGLNQSDFPRQDNPVEIDLMQATNSRRGDRSRRGDDRYLFLESLISARHYLHLSFQHRHIKNNNIREPSLVIKMLLDYCHQHFSKASLPIIEHALHPFSSASFLPKQGYKGSYDRAWFTCLTAVQNGAPTQKIEKRSCPPTAELSPFINSQDIINCLKASLRFYAKKQLNLYIDSPEVRDYEPNYSIDGLNQYSLRADILSMLQGHCEGKGALAVDSANKEKIERVLASWLETRETWQLSGNLPFLIGIKDDLNAAFFDTLALQASLPTNENKRRAKGRIDLDDCSIDYDFYYDLNEGIRQIKLNPNPPSLRHLLELWLHYLILLIHVQEDEEYSAFMQSQSTLNENSFVTYDNEDIQANDLEKNVEDEVITLARFGAGMHFVEGGAGKDRKNADSLRKSIGVCRLTLAPQANPRKALATLVKVYQRAVETPMLIDLSLAEEILEFASAKEAFESKSLMAKWAACPHPPESGPNFFPNNEFAFLLGEMPAFTIDNIQVYFDCFGDMRQHFEKTNDIDLSAWDLSNNETATMEVNGHERL